MDAHMDDHREVANLRIPVEREIGTMKTWRILDQKFNHKHLDGVEMCCRGGWFGQCNMLPIYRSGLSVVWAHVFVIVAVCCFYIWNAVGMLKLRVLRSHSMLAQFLHPGRSCCVLANNVR